MRQNVRITFLNDFPEALRPEARRAIHSVAPLVSREIATVFVAMGDVEDEGIEGVVVIHTALHYHRANLWFSSEFFGYDEEEQHETLKHEFFHILVDPLTREIQRIIDNFIQDPVVRKHLMEGVAELEERVVDGLALSCYVKEES